MYLLQPPNYYSIYGASICYALLMTTRALRARTVMRHYLTQDGAGLSLKSSKKIVGEKSLIAVF